MAIISLHEYAHQTHNPYLQILDSLGNIMTPRETSISGGIGHNREIIFQRCQESVQVNNARRIESTNR